MAKRRKPIESNSIANSGDAIALFRRTMHAMRDIRNGLTRARTLVPARYFPEAIDKLWDSPVYRRAFVGEPFPKRMSDFRFRRRLAPSTEEKEIVWTANVLAKFKPELRQFVTLKKKIEDAVLGGDYNSAATDLDQVEEKLGVSIWLISMKLQILQLQDGLTAQKNYLETVLSADDLAPAAAWMSYYFSLRSEENVSLASLILEIDELIGRGDLGDYAISHIIPHDMSKISNYLAPIVWEEPHSVIDRFITFSAMITLRFARGEASLPHAAIGALEVLASTGEERLAQVVNLAMNRALSVDGAAIGMFDRYTLSDYSAPLERSGEFFELRARASLLSGASKTVGRTLDDEIVGAMADVLVSSESYFKSSARLGKLAITLAHSPASREIAAFVNRERDSFFPRPDKDIEQITALDTLGRNPWSLGVIQIATGRPLLKEAIAQYPSSSSLKLRQALEEPCDAGISIINDLPINDHRKSLYLGYVLSLNADHPKAIEEFRASASVENPYAQAAASAQLAKALLAANDATACLTFVTKQCVKNPGWFRLFDFEKIREAVSTVDGLKGDFSLAILLSLASRHISPDHERELSDIYENALAKIGADRPEGLDQFVGTLGKDTVTYILRYIAVPRILDSTTAYEDMAEIATARISICQTLLKLDPENRALYSEEIKGITRDENITSLLQQVEASKIYVDEDGIRSSAENHMRDSYSRYQVLVASPELNYQASKISKRIEILLGEKAEDIGEIKLPSSEKEGLFHSLLTDFGQQFALNPAYGLDTHISTGIRHGAFEGHIRKALNSEDLIGDYIEAEDKYLLPARWALQFSDLSLSQVNALTRSMERLAQKIDALIEKTKEEVLQVRQAGGTTEALFNFITTEDQRNTLMNAISSVDNYDEFLSHMFAFFWQLTERSLTDVRDYLLNTLLIQLNDAFETLISSSESAIGRENAGPLVDAIVRARTDMQANVHAVSEWFRRPPDVRREPVDVDVAVGVALKQIRNCYVGNNVAIDFNLLENFRLAGGMLDGFVEVLFLLLQNIVRHDGYPAEHAARLTINRSGESVILEISNSLSDSIDLAELRSKTTEAVERYQEDTAISMARKEGGSGLSKVWRILEYGLKRKHVLSIEVEDDRNLSVRLAMNAEGLIQC